MTVNSVIVFSSTWYRGTTKPSTHRNLQNHNVTSLLWKLG